MVHRMPRAYVRLRGEGRAGAGAAGRGRGAALARRNAELRRILVSRRTSQDLEVHAWVGLGGIANEISLARLLMLVNLQNACSHARL